MTIEYKSKFTHTYCERAPLNSAAYKIGNTDAKRYNQGGAVNVTETARNVHFMDGGKKRPTNASVSEPWKSS